VISAASGHSGPVRPVMGMTEPDGSDVTVTG
jgi:hypothetical protein